MSPGVFRAYCAWLYSEPFHLQGKSGHYSLMPVTISITSQLIKNNVSILRLKLQYVFFRICVLKPTKERWASRWLKILAKSCLRWVICALFRPIRPHSTELWLNKSEIIPFQLIVAVWGSWGYFSMGSVRGWSSPGIPSLNRTIDFEVYPSDFQWICEK